MVSSPLEDFSENTLAAIPGVLGKLRYLANLREDGGEYHHWGMERRHGRSAASHAIADSHAEIFSLILRTPISELWAEVNQLAAKRGSTPQELALEMFQEVRAMTPRDLRGGGKRHFSLVLRVLSALAISPGAKIHPNALQSQPPVQ